MLYSQHILLLYVLIIIAIRAIVNTSFIKHKKQNNTLTIQTKLIVNLAEIR
jgi:hypothetical protein